MSNAGAATERLTVLYIASTSYSGSTLLSLLLDRHPEMTSVGEMTGLTGQTDPRTYACSCGETIVNCPFWKSIREGMDARGHEFDVGDFQLQFSLGPSLAARMALRSSYNTAVNALRDAMLRLLPAYRARLGVLRARNRAFVASALAVTGKQIFVDASKDPIRARYLAEVPGLDVKVVHLLRDVRGTANSYRKNHGRSAQWGAKIWRRVHREIERVARWRRLPVLRVRYEDLCADPAVVMTRIAAFAGLPPGTPLEAAGALSEQHVLGNRMRLAGSAIRLDEKWRDELTPPVQDEVLRIAGSLHERYGYGGK